MIIIGIIVAPSPIPFGIIFVALGFFLLAATAPDLVRWLRRRWRWFDRQIKRLERILPRWMTAPLRNTDPDDEEEDEDEEDNGQDDTQRTARS